MPQKLNKNTSISSLAVELRDLKFKYQSTQAAVLSIDEWQLKRGERAFIYGPSGSGKSTLLNLLAGLTVPNQGTVRVLGRAINELNGSQRDRFRACHIGVIFQQFNLIPWLNVQGNITAANYFTKGKKLSKRDLKIRTEELMTRLCLPLALLARKTMDLSIGQQQRVAIARALINKPELIIADEPTSALDTDSRDRFMQLLLECIDEQNSTLIFVSHDKALASEFDNTVDLQKLNLTVKDGGGVK